MDAKFSKKHLLGNRQADCLKPCKGRSKDLVRLRNLKMVKVFYKLSEIDRCRIDDVLKIMSTEEFFLCERTIWNIIRNHTQQLDALSHGESIDEMIIKQDKNQLKLEI
jgi:hypothetical protein